MLRKEFEEMMKKRCIKQIDVLLEGKRLPIYCTLGSTGLKDYTNHMVNRKVNIIGYLDWTCSGNCDLILVNKGGDRLPWMRGGFVCEETKNMVTSLTNAL